jgi:gamma-glutamyltranspeptidase
MPVIKKDKELKPEKRQLLRGLWFLFNVGWYVALSLVVPTAIGLWLDAPERFNSRPLCTLIGFALGTMMAGFGLYRMLRQLINEQKEMDTKKNSIDKEQDSE